MGKRLSDLDKYTTEQILAEIELANTFLQALDGKKTRTFAIHVPTCMPEDCLLKIL
jgi:hypothetical protein